MSAAPLLDSMGRRNNRKHADKACPQCGKMFKPYRETSRYCSRPCMWSNNGGHNMKAEVWWESPKGYIEGSILIDGKKVRVRQHRYFMEQALGHRLSSSEDVHHKNGDKTDNRLENLEVLTHGEHSREHNLSRTYVSGYRMNLSDAERQRRSVAMRIMRLAQVAGAKS